MLKTVAFGSAARGVGLASQFVVLIILGRMLPKNEFGNMMIAFAAYRIVYSCLATGLGNVVLYHVARSGGDVELDVCLHRTAMIIGLICGGGVTVASTLVAPVLAEFLGKPELVPWLLHMAPLAVFGTLNQIAMSSLDGRSHITRSIMLTEVTPNALRLIALFTIYVMSLPTITIAYSMWISVAIPWLWEARGLFTRQAQGFGQWSLWDTRYAAQFTLWAVASLQLQGVDLLLVGYLFTSEQAADYAFVSRLAALTPFFHNIIGKQFAPRAARACHKKEIAAFQRELDRTRIVDLIATALNCAAVIVGAWVVAAEFLPQFATTMGLLVLFSIGTINRAFHFGNDKVLQTAGYGFESLLIQLASLTNLIGLGIAGSHQVGLAVIPIAMALSSIVLNPIMNIVIFKRIGLRFATGVHLSCFLIPMTGLAGAALLLSPDGSTIAACVIFLLLSGASLVRLILERYPIRLDRITL